MLKQFIFYVIILLSNIIQGITGFAGTILAMPFSLKLVGYDTAVPILNMLGILSGAYVLIGNYKSVDWKELRRIVVVMGSSIMAGVFIKRLLSGSGNMQIMYYILGGLILIITVRGFYNLFWLEPALAEENEYKAKVGGYISGNRNFHDIPHESYFGRKKILLYILLILAGLVHGMFVCGGPLLIGYLTKRVKTAATFRATISTVWIFLNGIILITQLMEGMWSVSLVKTQVISVPFLFLGLFIGGMLYKKMSQRVFMILTYILLAIAGLSLFFK